MTAGKSNTLICVLLAVLTALSLTGCAQAKAREAVNSATHLASDVADSTTPSPDAPSTENPNSTAPAEEAEADVDFTDLDTCVSQTIIDYNKGHYVGGEFQTESHVTLKTVEDGNMTTVYLMAFYAEFDFANGETTLVGGSHIPVAITFSRDSDGVYSMTEYWEASDGAGYADSIKQKFPADVADQAMDTQVYVEEQSAECYEKAKEYLKNR